jgi:bile acid:Na+ symporter, BASS family
MDHPIFLMLVTVTIFTLMLALGVNHSFQQLTSLLRRPQLLLRSLLAVIVLVPVFVGLLLWLLELPSAIAAGLAVLAAAPGAPLTYKRTEMAGGDLTYSASLQLTLALLAVVVTPLILAIFNALFKIVGDPITPFHVARQVAEVTFLPVIIGLLIQRFAPHLAKAIGKQVRIIANLLFILLLAALIFLILLAPDFRMMLNLCALATGAIIIMVAVSLAIGHFLGGPLREQRSVLAIATIARNVGLALFIASRWDNGQNIIPTLLTYLIWGALLGVLYSIWSKRCLLVEKNG